MAHLELFCFGSPQVMLDGQPLALETRKALALFCYLAMTESAHSRESLAAHFWPEQDEGRARGSLRRALYAIRQTCGDATVNADAQTVRLEPTANLWVDVLVFRADLDQATLQPLIAATAAQMARTLDLYRGDFLSGFTLPDCPGFDQWSFFQAEDDRRRLGDALQRLIDWHSQQQEFAIAATYAQRLVQLDPLHEPAQRTLMQLLTWSGQLAAALRQYELCEKLLADELGVEPDAQTVDLHAAIRTRRLRPPTTHEPAAITPASQPPAVARHNLPISLPPLIGREAELDTLAVLLGDPDRRLCTIVGPGGMGKTRLALAAAIHQLEQARYADGVYVVELASVQTVEGLVPALTEVLRLETAGQERTPQQQVLDYLREKQLLLVLDNFEQLLEGAGLVAEILQTAPAVRILATSREPLALYDEQVYPLAGLAVPTEMGDFRPDEYAAVRLFLDRARRQQPGITLRPDDWRAVGHLCRLVGGVPLALELAAAWVVVLPLPTIVAELAQSLDVLEADMRDVPERHRSMRAVFDATWQRLSAAEQGAFAQLSLFRGGFTRQVAQQVASVSLRLLSSLVHRSLVSFDRGRDRYTLHELLRQYGSERLARNPASHDAARSRHGVFFCALLQTRTDDLKGAHQKAALDELETERENSWTAWRWAVAAGELELVHQAADGLGMFAEWMGYYAEAAGAFHALAESLEGNVAPAARRLLAQALAWQSSALRVHGDAEAVAALLDRSLALLDELVQTQHTEGAVDVRRERAFALLQQGQFLTAQDKAAAHGALEASLALYRDLGSRWEVAIVLTLLANPNHDAGGHSNAQALGEEALTLLRTLGDRRGMADVMAMLSLSHRFQGQTEKAVQLAEESYELYRQLGHQSGSARGLFALAQSRDWMGKHTEAQALMEQCIDLYAEMGDRPALAYIHVRYGGSMYLGRDYAGAEAHMRRGLALAQTLGDEATTAFAYLRLSTLLLDQDRFDESLEHARASLSLWRKIGRQNQVGRAHTACAAAAVALGDISTTLEHLRFGLATGLANQDFYSVRAGLYVLALWYCQVGNQIAAAELKGLLDDLELDVYLGRLWEHVNARVAELPPDVAAAARARGRAKTRDEFWRKAEIWLAVVDDLRSDSADSPVG